MKKPRIIMSVLFLLFIATALLFQNCGNKAQFSSAIENINSGLPDPGTPNNDCNDPNGCTDHSFTDQSDVVTLAYEDIYPGPGDYDFNDYLLNQRVVETYNSTGGLEKIVIDYLPKKRISGAEHSIVLVFDGQVRGSNSQPNVKNFVSQEMFEGNAVITYQLVDTAGNILKEEAGVAKNKDLVIFPSTRSTLDDKGNPLQAARVTITGLDKSKNNMGVRGRVSIQRYRTLLRLNSYDIDLGDINPNMFDSQNIPLAVFVPTNWEAPAEGQNINTIYSKFKDHAQFLYQSSVTPGIVEDEKSLKWFLYP